MTSKVRRHIVLAAASLAAIFCSYQAILNLSHLKDTVNPEADMIRMALALSSFLFSILGGWYAYQLAGGALFAAFAALMVFFIGAVAASPLFVWFLISFVGFCYVLYRIEVQAENSLAVISVDREQLQNEKNDLEIAHKTKGEGISILFEKYSTYYNLRKLAEELAVSLSVEQLSASIVKHSQEFVGRGDVALLALKNNESPQLSLRAFCGFSKTKPWEATRYHGADLFDLWVIKNQRRLIVTDAHQDFRFDVKETSRQEDLRSVIIAPLLHERRVIGTLRINAASPEVFSNDDLRLLDTIAVLGSSAISNAMLYERTEELAIRDSLTQLYVRRYFFERFKDEHRRALLTHRPLSLLMCDLDHFKECNDRFGHAVGDLMLVEFAKILKQSVDHAIVARYGGEEFSVLLPETSAEDAVKIAEKIRTSVEANLFSLRRQRMAMTVSIGVANLPKDALDLEDLLHKADQALYQAKKLGRNKVCLSGS